MRPNPKPGQFHNIEHNVALIWTRYRAELYGARAASLIDFPI